MQMYQYKLATLHNECAKCGKDINPGDVVHRRMSDSLPFCDSCHYNGHSDSVPVQEEYPTVKHTPNVTRVSHYIAMAGLSGYLPNTVSSHDTLASAVATLCDTSGVSTTGRIARDLRKYNYADLSLARHGNEYAKITLCDCDNPDQHNDSY